MGKVHEPPAPSVLSLHRYPVKSMLGERLVELELDERGVLADRQWSVRTSHGKIGSGKNTRRFATVPHLQMARAHRTDGGGVVVTLPDGSAHDVGSPILRERLSRLVEQPVTLERETAVRYFDDGPVSLIALASVNALAADRGEPVDVARFRPNVVVDGVAAWAEERWNGRRLHLGTAILLVQMVSPRCVMVDSATADLPAQPGNLRALGRLNDAQLGVVARVVQPGVVRVGDSIGAE